jgi:hypothetical protein
MDRTSLRTKSGPARSGALWLLAAATGALLTGLVTLLRADANVPGVDHATAAAAGRAPARRGRRVAIRTPTRIAAGGDVERIPERSHVPGLPRGAVPDQARGWSPDAIAYQRDDDAEPPSARDHRATFDPRAPGPTPDLSAEPKGSLTPEEIELARW